MKKITEGKHERIRHAVWIGLTGAGLSILAAGCGNTPAPETDKAPVLPEKMMEITIVNASNVYIMEVLVNWSDEIEAGAYDILGHAGKEGLEPGEVFTAQAPVWDGMREITVWDQSYEDIYGGQLLESMREGDILVLTPEFTGTQVVYSKKTGADEAKELALEAYQEEENARLSVELERERLAQEEEEREQEAIQEAVLAKGYDSLEEMRRAVFPTYLPDMADFPKLTGRWYPDGDRESRSFFVVDDHDVLRFYEFQTDMGEDVETENQKVVGQMSGTYRLSDGRTFVLKDTPQEKTIRFTDGDTVYQWDGY